MDITELAKYLSKLDRVKQSKLAVDRNVTNWLLFLQSEESTGAEESYADEEPRYCKWDGKALWDSEWRWSPASPTSGWLGVFTNRIKITVDSSSIDSELTYFPLYVHISTSSGKTGSDLTKIFDEVGSDYGKIAITLGDGVTRCYIEVEKWNAGEEEACLWVSRSDLIISSVTNTDLYIYYDYDISPDTTYIGTTGSTAGKAVWDSSFALVDHMRDGADNQSTLDSTINANNGTKGAAGGPTEVAGKIAMEQDFDGTERITYPDSASLETYTQKTVELIFKCAGFSGTRQCLFDDGYWHSSGGDLIRLDSTTNVVQMLGKNSEGDLISLSVAYTPNQYQAYAYSWDGVQVRAFSNGIFSTSGSLDAILNCSRYVQIVGAQNSTGALSLYFTGQIEELRVSRIARSDAWIKASKLSCWDNLLSYSSAEKR